MTTNNFINFHPCYPCEMSENFLELEMFLNSLFPMSSPYNNEIIYADNGRYLIRYTRFPDGKNLMEIKVNSLEKEKEKYKIINKDMIKFKMRNYNSAGVNFFEFPENI